MGRTSPRAPWAPPTNILTTQHLSARSIPERTREAPAVVSPISPTWRVRLRKVENLFGARQGWDLSLIP